MVQLGDRYKFTINKLKSLRKKGTKETCYCFGKLIPFGQKFVRYQNFRWLFGPLGAAPRED